MFFYTRKYQQIDVYIYRCVNETTQLMFLLNINIKTQSLFKSTSHTMSIIVSAAVAK